MKKDQALLILVIIILVLAFGCARGNSEKVRQIRLEAIDVVRPIPKSWHSKAIQAGLLVEAAHLDKRQIIGYNAIYVNARRGQITDLSKAPWSHFYSPFRENTYAGQNSPLAPNGRWLAFIYYNKKSKATFADVADIETGKRHRLVQMKPGWRIVRLSWNQITQFVMIATNDYPKHVKTQVLTVNPLTGRIGQVIIESHRDQAKWFEDVRVWPISLEAGKSWIGAYFGGPMLHIAGSSGRKRITIKIGARRHSVPAISPNGTAVVYVGDNAIWLRKIKLNSRPKLLLRIRPMPEAGHGTPEYPYAPDDSHIVSWPDDSHLLIEDRDRFFPGSKWVDTTVTVSAYKFDNSALRLLSRSTTKVVSWQQMESEYDDWSLKVTGAFIEGAGPRFDTEVENSYPTSPDGKGIVVGIDPRSYLSEKSKLLIYSYKKRGFLEIELHKKIFLVDALGWSKNWDQSAP